MQKRGAVERHCHRHRPRAERAGHFHLPGAGPGAFWLPRILRGVGRSDFERQDPLKARMEPSGPDLLTDLGNMRYAQN